MRRIAAILGLCALLSPMATRADEIAARPNEIVNEYGTVTINNTGIVCAGSELKSFGWIQAPPGHSLGSVSFSTGALVSGSIWSGGTFSSAGSTFDVVGVGLWAKHFQGFSHGRVTLFSGNFVRPIKWTLASHTGKYDYVFTLSGTVEGELYNGRFIAGTTKQTINVYQNQWFTDHGGDIRLGSTKFGVPEPGTLGLFGTGLIAFAGTMRRKLFGS